jgi:hypothetical protein
MDDASAGLGVPGVDELHGRRRSGWLAGVSRSESHK